MQHEGGLAAAVGAQQRHAFTRFQPEVHAVESRSAVVIAEPQVADFDQGRHQPALSMATRVSISRSDARAAKQASLRRKSSAPSVRKLPSNPRASMARWMSSARPYDRAKSTASAPAAARNRDLLPARLRAVAPREAAALVMCWASSEMTNKYR